MTATSSRVSFSARGEALPFEDGSFDLVVSSLMLHHLDTKTKVQALREWRRVLAQGGALLLVDFDVPRTRWLRVALWPLRFNIFEEQADNFRGRTPGVLAEAGLAFEEIAIYRSVATDCAFNGADARASGCPPRAVERNGRIRRRPALRRRKAATQDTCGGADPTAPFGSRMAEHR